jgi:hypothetical protein
MACCERRVRLGIFYSPYNTSAKQTTRCAADRFDVTDDLLTVKTNSGQMIEVEGQPLMYLLSQGYVPQVGSQVTLASFDEAGEFKVGEFTDHTGNQKVKLRDQSGRPMWSGRGQRG